MIVKKIHFVIDKTIKTKTFRKFVLRKYKNYLPSKSNVIVVVGGDGFMLETLKKYQKYQKPFYGINRGSFGFLMNKYKANDLKKSILKSKQVTISALEMIATTKNNFKKKVISINEVSLLRQLETTRLLAQYRQRIAASGRGGLRRRSEVTLSLARDLNEKISAGIGFRAYTIDSIQGTTKEQDYVRLTGQFTWRITPAISMEAGYIHTLLDRRDLGESANSNRFTLWLSYRPLPRGRLRQATIF